MGIVAKDSGGNFTPAPAGAHAAVCVDVVDLGILEVTYAGVTKSQHKIRIAWQIAEDMENGKPFLVQKRYTLSLHEKAALRKDLESWRGKAFTPQELGGFDVENLLHAPCMLNVIHETKDGKTYSNIASIMRLPKGMLPPVPRDYIRVIDRTPEGQQPPASEEIGDDDVPF